jgi:hypothetical protein
MRSRRSKGVDNFVACAACGERFTASRPSESFTALRGTAISVHAECGIDLKVCQGILKTDWQARRARESLTTGKVAPEPLQTLSENDAFIPTRHNCTPGQDSLLYSQDNGSKVIMNGSIAEVES